MALYNYVAPNGIIVVDTSEIRAQVEAEWRDALGLDLDLAPETPQGVLITAETLARAEVVRQAAQLANQINPNLAGGIFLDSIDALTGYERDEATYSVVPVDYTGVPGTLIPVGVTARTASNDVFENIRAVILSDAGTASSEMRAIETGPITAPANSLTQIVTGTLGWETVTNPVAATVGRLVESDPSARDTRRNALALQGQGLAEAIFSRLRVTEGVRSLAMRENVENSTQVIDGISLVAHSIWVCVDGGTDLDVATVLLGAKNAGSNWNGPVTVAVVEPYSGQTYQVKFERPTPAPVQVRVTVRNSSLVADPVKAVKDAILAYAAGELADEVGFTVGNSVSAFELAGAINQVNPGLFVTVVEVSSDGINWVSLVAIPLNGIATVQDSGITVTVI